MVEHDVRKLAVGDRVACGPFAGTVTCVDMTDDDKIVIKWECAESEDVLSDSSPLWHQVAPL